MAVQPGNGPTVRRILLGSQLRRLRESKTISRKDAGFSIRASESKISRMELGRVSFKERDVADLLTLYGVTEDADRAPLLSLAHGANQACWWQKVSDAMPAWFHPYMGLEEAAALIRTYEIQFVPGLLQTEAYARAIVTQGGEGIPEATVARRVSVRIRRQSILTRPNPPLLWVVMDEAALRRPIGGPAVMRAQLEHLIRLTEQSNITIQIMPATFGGVTAGGGAFSILRFSEPALPDVVYLEHLTGASCLDRQEDVECYLDAMNRLVVDSIPPEITKKMIIRILASHDAL
jgi:hypothetical protein